MNSGNCKLQFTVRPRGGRGPTQDDYSDEAAPSLVPTFVAAFFATAFFARVLFATVFFAAVFFTADCLAATRFAALFAARLTAHRFFMASASRWRPSSVKVTCLFAGAVGVGCAAPEPGGRPRLRCPVADPGGRPRLRGPASEAGGRPRLFGSVAPLT